MLRRRRSSEIEDMAVLEGRLRLEETNSMSKTSADGDYKEKSCPCDTTEHAELAEWKSASGHQETYACDERCEEGGCGVDCFCQDLGTDLLERNLNLCCSTAGPVALLVP
jgi:hypothetical protein